MKQHRGAFISAREHLLKREEKKEIVSSLSLSPSVAVGMKHELSSINLKGLHELRLCPEALETNLSLDSIDVAVQELKVAKVDNWVIVDCTPSQLGRNPSGLVGISLRTGNHVVSTCSNMLFLWRTTFCFFCNYNNIDYVCQLRGGRRAASGGSTSIWR